MKHAPSNYEHGKIYKVPFSLSRRPYWVLVEPIPDLVAPEPSREDDVFEEAVFVPGVEDDEMFILDMNVDPDTDASIDISLDYLPTAEETTQYTSSIPLEEPEETDEAFVTEDSMPEQETRIREELKEVLDKAGVEYKTRTRTTTLQKLVDELAVEE